MSYLESTVSHRSQLLPFVLATVAYSSVSLLLDNALLGRGIFLQLSDGLAFPLGILLGVPAALGIAVGAVLTDVIRDAVVAQTLVESVSLFVLAYGGRELWRRNPSISFSTLTLTTVSSWLQVAITGTLSSVVAASILAWGYEILGLFPFYVSFLSAVQSYLVTTLPLTALLVYTVTRTNLRRWFDVSHADRRPDADSRTFWTITLVSGTWAILGVVGSIGFTTRQKIPREAFRRYNVEFLYEFVDPDVFGQAGRRVQILLGAVMLVAGLFAIQTKPNGRTD